MLRRPPLFVSVFTALALAAASTGRSDEIQPPLGRRWGESSIAIEKLLRGAKATITAKRAVSGGLEAWDVEGIAHNGLKRTVFYFRKNSAGIAELVEMELQYQRDDWDQRRYDDFMGELRKAFQRKLGEGSLIARKDMPEGDVVQRLVGYKWTQNNTAVELFYFSAQNAQNVFRTISVHYKSN